MANRTTSAHVAAAAGVSRATVSYVLNNRVDKQISETTRQSVLAAARELDYNPSPAARALRSGRGDVVVALVPSGWDTGGEIGRLLAEVGRELGAHGLAFMRSQVVPRPGFVRELLQSVTAACVVSFEPLSDADQAVLDGAGIGEVRAWMLPIPGARSSMRIDQRDIVRIQIEHLLTVGCERIVYAADGDARDDDFVVARTDAFVSLQSELDLLPHPPTFFSPDRDKAAEALCEWTRVDTRMGVCAFSDIVAARLLSIARDLGIDVPEQMSVIGVDNSPFADYLVPPLSSVAFDLTHEAKFVAADVVATLDPAKANAPEGDHSSVWVVHRAST
ncbi:hypothetical protein CH298_27995 [Rhodococcoides fascians]|uniref:LacI family DNA-binding transcriptional regulator n=1 Tax=Rhodococcoides fascians TaxID=1828 RepID=UPI000B9C1948|nr:MULTISPECIES: LacI family DNA-binding transcriptional regulator [Rhodococcus]OZD69006.1 hypothetical protein CH263_09010 [Rhodococcus sp. 06-1059B-a]OZE81327.1 hypothetical protein CH303_27750 [Rhodococcus fascians]OZF08514.1 hypothetical protein CH298_27995 [Rhodococcus fascians]OZF10929.1 hypothetical protein CH297_28175 [Rhodococcus fascians]OZF59112.1 hypothetical protein CH308_28015 [Rhodococcus fascians]